MLSVALATLLSLTFITDPLDRIFNEKTLRSDLADILVHDTPDSSTYKAISEYLLVTAFVQEQLMGKTYREILEMHEVWHLQQKIREEQEKAHTDRADLDEQRRYERLRKVVEISLADIEAVYADSALTIRFQYSLKNKSDKRIRAVEGFLELNYGLHTYFQRVDLSFAIPIKARASHQEQVTTTFKRINEEGSSAGNAPLGKAKLIWRPEKVLLENGVTMD